jgi:hypothetical protein
VGDAAALRQAAIFQECFEQRELTALDLAAARFFDAHPRRFLEELGAVDGGERLLSSISLLPVELRGDLRAQVPLLERRTRQLDENSDLLDDRARGRVVLLMYARLQDEMSELHAALPAPEVLEHPVFGLPLPYEGARWEPVPTLFLTLADEARGLHRRIFAMHWTRGLVYMVVGGQELVYEPGNPRPVALRPEIPWVQVVDDRHERKSITVLGPASELFANQRIPLAVRAALCASFVSSHRNHFIGRRGFQAALDARIAKDPSAGLAKPVRDGLQDAGFDVSRFRELPGEGRCGREQ